MAFNEPFNLYHWFVNVFAGSLEIFFAISFLFIAVMAGMFRMPTMIVGVFFSLFVITIAYISNLDVLAVVMIGLVVGYIFATWFK